MEDLRETTCACGCGRTFRTRSDTRVYVDSGCWRAANTQPHEKSVETPEDRDIAQAARARRDASRKTYPKLQGSSRTA